MLTALGIEYVAHPLSYPAFKRAKRRARGLALASEGDTSDTDSSVGTIPSGSGTEGEAEAEAEAEAGTKVEETRAKFTIVVEDIDATELQQVRHSTTLQQLQDTRFYNAEMELRHMEEARLAQTRKERDNAEVE